MRVARRPSAASAVRSVSALRRSHAARRVCDDRSTLAEPVATRGGRSRSAASASRTAAINAAERGSPGGGRSRSVRAGATVAAGVRGCAPTTDASESVERASARETARRSSMRASVPSRSHECTCLPTLIPYLDAPRTLRLCVPVRCVRRAVVRVDQRFTRAQQDNARDRSARDDASRGQRRRTRRGCTLRHRLAHRRRSGPTQHHLPRREWRPNQHGV